MSQHDRGSEPGPHDPGHDPGSDEPTRQGPGERRLAAPPSARYGPAPEPAAGAGGRTAAQAVVGAALVSLLGATVIFLLAAVLAETTGLLAVAGIGGITVGWTLRSAGRGLAPRPRVVLAIVFALDVVILGNLATWAFAVGEGGVLGPIDYLAETFGPLVVAELAVAAFAGWVAAR